MSATLNPCTLLQGGRYRIDRVLGQGGFGITYLGFHIGFARTVAVKEFFMDGFCQRDETSGHVTLGIDGSREMVERYCDKFLKEARNIFRLNHPHIIRVIDVFEENGTAYFVMEYAQGGSLASKVKAEGALPEAVATRYILQVADALRYIHGRSMNHLDIKPDNIMLDEYDNAVLIDFGLAKQYDASGGQTSTTPIGFSEGYAPLEQYRHGGVAEFSPATDIYSLGATFFFLLTGQAPPPASDVYEDGVPVDVLRQCGVSETAISVIEQAMEPRKKARMCSAQVFAEGLGTAPTAPESDEDTRIVKSGKAEIAVAPSEETSPVVEPIPESKPTSVPMPKSKKWWIVGAVASVAIVASAFFMLRDNDGSDSAIVSGSAGGHEYVDLGLPSGTLWATCNVGASKPEEYGDYFAWGETKPKKYYDWDTYFDTSDGGKTFSKYNNDGGKTELDLEDDAAYKNWGEGWRMPSQAQIAELKDNCNWEWTSVNGVEGYVVQSKKNNSSLFLPAAGRRYEGSLDYAGSYGYYWSRSLNASYSDCAYYLNFYSSYIGWYNTYRCNGFSVRPVRVSASE